MSLTERLEQAHKAARAGRAEEARALTDTLRPLAQGDAVIADCLRMLDVMTGRTRVIDALDLVRKHSDGTAAYDCAAKSYISDNAVYVDFPDQTARDWNKRPVPLGRRRPRS